MKREEILELDGVEYTVELNRQSAIKIEKYSNLQENIKFIKEPNIEYVDEIKEDENPFATEEDFDKMEEIAKSKLVSMKKVITRAFWIWLYPKHELSYTKVENLLKNYLDENNSDKFQYITELFGEYLTLSSDISVKYNEEQKNLNAQINK